MSITQNDVREASWTIVHQPTSLETSRFVAPAEADPTRRLDYQNHPRQRRMYVHEVHGNPSNLVAQTLHALGLPMPKFKYNEQRFNRKLHPAYERLTQGALSELQRIYDADAAGQHWVSIVKR